MTEEEYQLSLARGAMSKHLIHRRDALNEISHEEMRKDFFAIQREWDTKGMPTYRLTVQELLSRVK